MATELRDVVRSHRGNAILAWLLVVVVVLTAVADGVDGDVLWAGFALAVALIAVLPAVALRDPDAMLPWEVLGLAALPFLIRVLVVGETVAGMTFTGRVSTYLAVAAVALVIAVEMDLFTPVRMNEAFAVLFVAIATTAAAGIWALVQWGADVLLGTAFLLDGRPHEAVERALMWDFVAATVAGLGAGVLFELYFRRRRRDAAPSTGVDSLDPRGETE
jgi:hypothetical protein